MVLDKKDKMNKMAAAVDYKDPPLSLHKNRDILKENNKQIMVWSRLISTLRFSKINY